MANDAIYQRDILKLAAAATGAGEISGPHVHVDHDNMLCGDHCSVDASFAKDGAIREFAHQIRACILVQASASLLGEHAKGRTRAEIAALRQRVEAMLKQGAPTPPAPFADYEAFRPVAAHGNRHTCVLLPIEALLKAFGENKP